MSQFNGKSVIVTGGALGIGGGVSRAFANAGASVTIMDIDDQAGEALANELKGQGTTAQYISADAGTIEGCRATADARHPSIRRHRHRHKQRRNTATILLRRRR